MCTKIFQIVWWIQGCVVVINKPEVNTRNNVDSFLSFPTFLAFVHGGLMNKRVTCAEACKVVKYLFDEQMAIDPQKMSAILDSTCNTAILKPCGQVCWFPWNKLLVPVPSAENPGCAELNGWCLAICSPSLWASSGYTKPTRPKSEMKQN